MKQIIAAAALAAVFATAQAQPAPQQAQPAASMPTSKQLARLCEGCAWVQDVHSETRKGKGSGLGVIGGAVLGGLLGNQVGGGTGKKVATVGGAVAGGYAGNEVEKNMKKQTVWVVQLVNKDGSTRRMELGADPRLKAGDTVREKDGQLTRQ
ncbi:glycine zipper 2TM domain-containing protein [Roseateles saccharophilus]|uniref:Glycine zipper 2TM protein n=1 Tax=Roseateles saccharophilus TaxID=304 RepID=A0A4R3UEY1_ROSSA|nr:glycine zipper 2TM domain-containing protein [Roseateles saccharophilus]TCU88268.1 glycine zipper 2TM protein [Roseateles saccharophilus]